MRGSPVRNQFKVLDKVLPGILSLSLGVLYRSALRFTEQEFIFTIDPTDKSVGYFRFVRFADDNSQTVSAKPNPEPRCLRVLSKS